MLLVSHNKHKYDSLFPNTHTHIMVSKLIHKSGKLKIHMNMHVQICAICSFSYKSQLPRFLICVDSL